MEKELDVLKDTHSKKHVSSSHFNGSEDDLVKIVDYKMPFPKREFELLVNTAKKMMKLNNFFQRRNQEKKVTKCCLLTLVLLVSLTEIPNNIYNVFVRSFR